MTRAEAQFILGAYRPSNEDAHDPQFHEALALARRDPVLARWFAAHQALDRAFSAKLRSCPPPPELKAQLLLALTTVRRVPWWRRPGTFAVAAGLALFAACLGTTWLTTPREDDFARFRHAMVQASLAKTGHTEVAGLDPAGYQHWIAAHHGNPDFVLPPQLAGKGIAACRILDWQAHRVTMLCFDFPSRHLDLFVVNASDLTGPALDATPRFFAAGRVTTAAWRREGKIYFAAGTMPPSELQKLI